ncbi:hypothetical protein AKJ09_04609 [Labilithrix luteola]|uniref:Uncharacterized protein n=2 Tax=Labilithrix luteola TaxID=1391654 RepID=A0A0K1PWN7_9BACT|nr:hypothetical protein AKJ09_04609 [Labilithrix luteola]
MIAREIELLAAQFETLIAAVTERERVRGAMASDEIPTPRWLRTLAILAVDIEFLVSHRDVVDLAAVADVCGEVERLLAREADDDEVRSCLRKAIESSPLVRAIAGEAERQSRRVRGTARLAEEELRRRQVLDAAFTSSLRLGH